MEGLTTPKIEGKLSLRASITGQIAMDEVSQLMWYTDMPLSLTLLLEISLKCSCCCSSGSSPGSQLAAQGRRTGWSIRMPQ